MHYRNKGPVLTYKDMHIFIEMFPDFVILQNKSKENYSLMHPDSI